MAVAQIGGELWQTLLDIVAGTIPAQECRNRITMAQVVNAGTGGSIAVAQAYLSRHRAECEVDALIIDATALIACEEISARPSLAMRITPSRVVLQHGDRGRVDGNDARFTKLGIANGQDAAVQIDIIPFNRSASLIRNPVTASNPKTE